MELSEHAREFYRWVATGQLRLQRCLTCQEYRHVPRVRCPYCAADGWEWSPVCGAGAVFSWTTTERPLHPDFVDVPFTVVLVMLAEGPRLLGRFDGDPRSLRIELPVVVSYDRAASSADATADGARADRQVVPVWFRAAGGQ